jgi:hypothetical protein
MRIITTPPPQVTDSVIIMRDVVTLILHSISVEVFMVKLAAPCSQMC